MCIRDRYQRRVRVCEPNYYAADCSVFCDANSTCSGLGSCNVLTGTCLCDKAGFGGDCTDCAENYYPPKDCTRVCERHRTCSGRGDCSNEGHCLCDNTTLYNPHDCSVKLWVIITPCTFIVVAFALFYWYLTYWKKRQSMDDLGEPLLW
eukprot:TRINITY_DN404_c0_g1_i13.p3 TRINITY_DN404_c0_g1~~TRINITY_DN404_c0_g1_i13.p3  ORF type:complete len:149 (-),score=47.95 TRINITY_DN404_c0_g1_i13:101-547(-)